MLPFFVQLQSLDVPKHFWYNDWNWIKISLESEANYNHTKARWKFLSFQFCYLLLINDPSTMRLSSSSATVSVVSFPFKSNSPRLLNVAKENSWALQSATTCCSFASISFSLTADMQISCKVIYGHSFGFLLSLRGFMHTLKLRILAHSTFWEKIPI